MKRFFDSILAREQVELNDAKSDRDRLFGAACRAGSGADADTQWTKYRCADSHVTYFEGVMSGLRIGKFCAETCLRGFKVRGVFMVGENFTAEDVDGLVADFNALLREYRLHTVCNVETSPMTGKPMTVWFRAYCLKFINEFLEDCGEIAGNWDLKETNWRVEVTAGYFGEDNKLEDPFEP